MVFNLLSTIFTGDYLGYASTGVFEDDPIVATLIHLHHLFFG